MRLVNAHNQFTFQTMRLTAYEIPYLHLPVCPHSPSEAWWERGAPSLWPQGLHHISLIFQEDGFVRSEAHSQARTSFLTVSALAGQASNSLSLTPE